VSVPEDAYGRPAGAGAPAPSVPWRSPGATPFVRIEGVSRHYGDFAAVDGVDLDVYKGEIFCLLGGSGCGKTTLLRILAGLERPSAGRVVIDGVDVTDLPPYERPVNMMFQSYALFPHMTVEQNVAYGLRKEGVPAREIAARVTEMLNMVQLGDFARRKPDQLSGGQRQRVALARALVKRPKLLLLDEPLAALDKKLRQHTQFELANIQYQLGVTFIVVTHDQEEAMALSSRIAVMDRGRIIQVGTPNEIYEYPKSRFIAEFIGTMNMFAGVVESCEDGLLRVRCEDTGGVIAGRHDTVLADGTRAWCAVRPEKILISPDAPDPTGRTVLRGVVFDLGYFGNLSLYKVKLPSGRIVQVSAQNRRRSAERTLEWDDEVYLSWDDASVAILTE
jgi:putrescine transport system ATP-binding protein